MGASVGIITTHRVHNCGSFLQAYALQVALKQMGFSSEYIDYIPVKKEQSINRFDAPVRFQTIMHLLLRDIWHRRWAFLRDDFKLLHWECLLNLKLSLSRRTFMSFEDLSTSCPKYDYYMVGSDQVWNERFMQNDAAFMLAFAPKGSKKISYASSIANTNWTNRFVESAVEHLTSFKKISCRERANAEAIARLIEREVTAVLDPVMLLSTDMWLRLLRIEKTKSRKSGYIFFFMLGYMQDVHQMALSVLDDAASENPELTVWSNIAVSGIDARIIEINTPSSFVKIISNANLVISDSFHAVAFSLLFNVPIMRVDAKSSTDVRIEDLCQRITFLRDNKYCLDVDKLEKERAVSLAFLRESLI